MGQFLAGMAGLLQQEHATFCFHAPCRHLDRSWGSSFPVTFTQHQHRAFTDHFPKKFEGTTEKIVLYCASGLAVLRLGYGTWRILPEHLTY